MTLTERETASLGAVVELCAQPVGETPLPWPVLELVGLLVPSDEITFCGLDSSAQGGYLLQEHHDGAEPVLELSDAPVVYEQDAAFWKHYWSSCAYPEVSGDFASITSLSDFFSAREWWAHPMRVDYLETVRWELMLALDDGVPRTVRLLCFRESGRDYDERERFVLTLLRPHLEQCYRAWQREQRADVTLTARQLELVGLLGEGLSNRQIARRLGLSEATVRTHLVNVYQRLGVNSRTAAVMQVLDLRTTVPEWRRRTQRVDVA